MLDGLALDGNCLSDVTLVLRVVVAGLIFVQAQARPLPPLHSTNPSYRYLPSLQPRKHATPVTNTP